MAHADALAGVGPSVRLTTLADKRATKSAEISAYLALLKRNDNGRAFLRIMRGYELTTANQEFFYSGLKARRYPAQIIWGCQGSVSRGTQKASSRAGTRAQHIHTRPREALPTRGSSSRSRRGSCGSRPQPGTQRRRCPIV